MIKKKEEKKKKERMKEGGKREGRDSYSMISPSYHSSHDALPASKELDTGPNRAP
jgi:hypothetical protein